MMVVSLFLILNFSMGVSASSSYDGQEADACITISERLSVKGGSESGLYRKVTNTGEFKGLHETMQIRNVKNIVKKAGIGLDGVKIKIDRNAELVGKGIYGYTDGKTITLYPDAFTDTETLVKTLGHERMHVYQTSIFGKPTSSDILQEFENGAYASESSWWQYFQSGGK